LKALLAPGPDEEERGLEIIENPEEASIAAAEHELREIKKEEEEKQEEKEGKCCH